MITTAYANRNMARLGVDILYTDWKKRPIRPFQLSVDDDRVSPVGAVVDPTMTLSYDAAQSLLQALWDAGFRPNDGDGSAGHVAALKSHIAFAERVVARVLK